MLNTHAKSMQPNQITLTSHKLSVASWKASELFVDAAAQLVSSALESVAYACE